jgi:hypothetical protein
MNDMTRLHQEYKRRESLERSEMELLADVVIRIAGVFAACIAGFILICMGLGI